MFTLSFILSHQAENSTTVPIKRCPWPKDQTTPSGRRLISGEELCLNLFVSFMCSQVLQEEFQEEREWWIRNVEIVREWSVRLKMG